MHVVLTDKRHKILGNIPSRLPRRIQPYIVQGAARPELRVLLRLLINVTTMSSHAHLRYVLPLDDLGLEVGDRHHGRPHVLDEVRPIKAHLSQHETPQKNETRLMV